MSDTLETKRLKAALLEEVSSGQNNPLEVIESLTGKGFPLDEVRTVLANLLCSGELLLTPQRLLQRSQV